MVGVYNRYQGNSGNVQRVEERTEPASPRTPPAHTPSGRTPPASAPIAPLPPPPIERRPPSPLSGLSGELGRLLFRVTSMEPDTEDLLLIGILYLLYRDSGDEEFLFMIAGLLLF